MTTLLRVEVTLGHGAKRSSAEVPTSRVVLYPTTGRAQWIDLWPNGSIRSYADVSIEQLISALEQVRASRAHARG